MEPIFGAPVLEMRLKIRKADITDELRDTLDLFGKEVVALALGLGRDIPGGGEPTWPQQVILNNERAATEWLREKRDEDERHATASLSLEASRRRYISDTKSTASDIPTIRAGAMNLRGTLRRFQCQRPDSLKPC